MAKFPYETTEFQAEILDWVRTFADKHIAPVAAHYDEVEQTPWPVIEQAAEAGLYSLEFLQTIASDPDGLLMAMVAEELAAVDAGITLALLGTLLPVTAILTSGTAEQQARFLPECFGTPAQPKVAAFVASEPEAGSDVGAIRCKARFDEVSGQWRLDGVKTWGTNAGIADVHVITAVVDPQLGPRGQAAFIVPKSSTEGISQGQKFSKMGIRASHTAEVVLEDCRVPADNVLGGFDRLQERLARARRGEHARGQAALKTFEATRPLVAAMAVGIARAALEYATRYATERVQFGRPVAANQAVGFQLADMHWQVEAARLLTHRAASMLVKGAPFTFAEGSQAKLVAGETAVAVTDRAISILGGAGYTRDHPVEKWHRDAKIFTIFEGTSEIQRLVIARAVTGLRLE